MKSPSPQYRELIEAAIAYYDLSSNADVWSKESEAKHRLCIAINDAKDDVEPLPSGQLRLSASTRAPFSVPYYASATVLCHHCGRTDRGNGTYHDRKCRMCPSDKG